MNAEKEKALLQRYERIAEDEQQHINWLNEALNKSGEGLDEWIMNIEGVPSEEIWLGIRNISEARQNIRSVINDINISLDILKNIKEQ